MKKYYRIMLGRKSVHADECLKGGFLGTGFGIKIDLTGKLPDNWRDFNREFIPIYLKNNPDKSKIAAGLACGFLHTVSKGIKIGDIILSPNGLGRYLVGEVTGEYTYHPEGILPHRRAITWYTVTIDRADMSEALRNSAGSIGTVSDISQYVKELETLIDGVKSPSIVATDEAIEDPSIFALENHLEEFLIQNWDQTEIGKNYRIFEDGDLYGQQYPTDTGYIDILAISKDKKELLVIELKKGRASDVVVGQIQRYMGYVIEELAEKDQKVKGIIIAHEDDLKLKRALSVTNNIEFYRYQVSFRLIKG